MKQLALGVIVFILCAFCYTVCQAAPERTYIVLPEGTVEQQDPQSSAEVQLSSLAIPKVFGESSRQLLFSASPVLMHEIKL